MKTILFVCTGNTCRSCMAEGIFNAEISKHAMSDKYHAYSAGISAFDGQPASMNSINALKDYRIDMSTHRSSCVTADKINHAYLVLTMTREHKAAILSRYPHAVSKVHTLKEYVEQQKSDHTPVDYNFSLDIPDPYGMPLGVYKKCAEDIKSAVDKLVKNLSRYEE